MKIGRAPKPSSPSSTRTARCASDIVHEQSKGSYTTPTSILAVEVLQGKERVVCFPRSYHSRLQGTSACALAALNFARVSLRIADSSCRLLRALNKIASSETVDEVIPLCVAGWLNDLHLEVEEISQIPFFKHTLTHMHTSVVPPQLGHFRNILQAMASLQKSAAVIITRLPDIITCLQVTDANSGQNAYVIFDPHPRPLHPDGAGLIFNSSLDNAANILGGILHVHKDRISSSNLQWGAQLRTDCSGYFFVAKCWRRYTGKSVLKSSLTVLALRSAIQQQNDALAFRNGKHDEVATLEDASNQETLKATKATTALSRQEHTQGRRDYYQLNAVAGPSRLPFHDRVPQYNGAQGINPPPLPPRKLRNAFDAKDAVPRYQEAELKSPLRKRFDCGICLEKCPEDDAAKVDGCGHTMCRGCMKGFITAKIAEHRFPILCPICTVDDGGRPAAEISRLLVEQIGITEEEFGIWTEMELSQYSILLRCRKCKRSAFVDRDDYNEMSEITCPLPGCSYVWCKFCHRRIKTKGPKHSCDGSSELDHLVKTKGWKYCPNCKTPIQKDNGCNHMTCIAPGCNTHFCYICGDLIVRSAVGGEINRAVTSHYTKCQLLQVPE